MLLLSRVDFTSAGLTLVGVGPGDPSLLTLAAIRAIEGATVVAYPIPQNDGIGMAAQIAAEWIQDRQRRLPLLFPMVHDLKPLKDSWLRASNQISSEVAKGERVVFLCMGDVSLFATGSYLLIDLKQRFPECPVRLVPGISAISAAAAIGSWPLALQRDQLLVLPTPDIESALEALLDEAANSKRVLALLKLGHRWTWVKPLLARRKLLQGSLFAERVGWPDQKVLPAEMVSEGTRNYFSMLLVRQVWPDVMP